MIQQRDACTNTVEPVLEVLWAKHPEACAPLDISLDAYPGLPPELIHIDMTDDKVIAVMRRLSGGSRSGGTDSVNLQHFLI